MHEIQYIDNTEIKNQTVLIRVDFNVSLTANSTIADDARIKQSLPTIKYLLQNNNKLIIVSHLGRPKGRDPKYSLKIVADKLQEYFPQNKIQLINDFLTDDLSTIKESTNETIYLLENIRFYPEEKANDIEFAKRLAALAQVYVNDAFGVSHRSDASVVGITQFLPSYCGLLLKKEIEMISKVISNPSRPFVAILGGIKISTKLNLIGKLLDISDYILIGGGIANILLKAQGYTIGKSLCEDSENENAKRLLELAKKKNKKIVLPDDVVVSNSLDSTNSEVKKINEITDEMQVFDIGPETQAKFGSIIEQCKTIIWNGPVGYFENPTFRRGTDFIYYTITDNHEAVSIVGGGDTLNAISKKEYIGKITHISTGGGAMLEFIEKGTLPGIDALKNSKTS